MWTFLYSVHCLESGHIFKCILFSCKNFNSSPTIFFFFSAFFASVVFSTCPYHSFHHLQLLHLTSEWEKLSLALFLIGPLKNLLLMSIVRKIPWSRKWQPTPVFLPGKSHGQRSLVGYNPWSHNELDSIQQLNNNNQEIDVILEVINEKSLTKLVNIVKGVEIKESQEGDCLKWRDETRHVAMCR